MALQVWLSFIGDLENKGLAETSTISTSYLSFLNNGKIGKCMHGRTGHFNIPEMEGKKQISVAYWLRIDTATETNWLDPFRWYSTNGSESYVSRNEYYNNTTRTGVWYKGGSLSDIGLVYEIGTWRHLAFSVNYETGEAKFYINGERRDTTSNVDTTHYISGNNFMIGENGLDTYFNDLRIYDHILSTKEVKELSKALVVHYPLSDKIGNPNLVAGVVGNSISLLHKEGVTLSTEDNCIKAEFEGTSNNRFYAFNDSNTWIKNETCTVSFYAKTDTEGLALQFSRSMADYAPDVTLTSDWAYYQIQITSNNTVSGGTLTVQSTIPGTVYIKLIKLEKGSVSTPWVPNVADDEYADLGLDDATIYDCSGYCRNGSIVGDPYASSNTPRYSVCIQFTSGSHYRFTDLPTMTDYTFSFWAAYRNNAMAFGYNNGNRFNLYVASNIFLCNTGDGANNPYVDSSGNNVSATQYYYHPHHYVIVSDGSKVELYVDAKLIGTAKTYKAITGTELIMNGWAISDSYLLNNIMSDFRIYATALSEEDIKELYETSASVDQNDNTWAYEFTEV